MNKKDLTCDVFHCVSVSACRFTGFLALLRNHCYSLRKTKSSYEGSNSGYAKIVASPAGVFREEIRSPLKTPAGEARAIGADRN